MLQAMAKFMEQGSYFHEGHQAGGIIDWRRLITNQVSHGVNQPAVLIPLAHQTFIHPGPTAFLSRSCVGIQIEGGDGGVLLLIHHLEETHIPVPCGGFLIGG